jgi:hypothetical protein
VIDAYVHGEDVELSTKRIVGMACREVGKRVVNFSKIKN